MGTNQRSQIVMTDDEIADFVRRNRTATMATVGRDGQPHLVAMWYGIIDGEIWFETKSKSQKAVNIRRNNRCSVMIEDGDTYDTLRGVTFEGTAEILDDPDSCLKVGISVWERYTAPYTEESRPFVEQMMNKRVAVRIRPSRNRSSAHRTLAIPEMPASGTTAEFL